MKYLNKGSILVGLLAITCLIRVPVGLASDLSEETNLDIEMSSGLGDLHGEYQLDEATKIQTGSLAIKAVSPIIFGKAEANGQLVTKLNEEVTADFPNTSPLDALGVEVHDLRGTGAGWTLKAILVDFSNEEGKKLTNFKLTIPTEKVATKSATPENLPTARTINFQDYGANSEVIVMEAKKNKGMGKFTNMFKSKKPQSKDITLFVPLTAHKGLYHGTILWSLDDVPN